MESKVNRALALFSNATSSKTFNEKHVSAFSMNNTLDEKIEFALKDTEVKAPINSTSGPWNHKEFVDRVKSFSTLKWFGQPIHLNPLECSRHGWSNVQKDTLECSSCKSRIVIGKSTNKIDLQKPHKNLCIWKGYPCPDSFVNGMDYFGSDKLLMKTIEDSSLEISNLKLSTNHIQSIERDISEEIASIIEILKKNNSDIDEQSLLLAAHGFEAAGQSKHCKCSFCFAYLPSSAPRSFADILKSKRRRLNDENGVEESKETEDLPVSLQKLGNERNRERKDLLKCHKWWCPYINDDVAYQSVCGWKRLVEAVKKGKTSKPVIADVFRTLYKTSALPKTPMKTIEL